MQVNYRQDGVLASVEGSPEAVERHFQELERDGFHVSSRSTESSGVDRLTLNGEENVKITHYVPTTNHAPETNAGVRKPSQGLQNRGTAPQVNSQSVTERVQPTANRDGVTKPTSGVRNRGTAPR